MNEPLARFIGLYQQLDKQQLHRLPEVYAEQVVFTDPAHRIEGLAALGDYFAALYQRLAYCRFVITSQQQQGQQAWLGWTMTFSHPRLRGGEPVTVEGATRLYARMRAEAESGQLVHTLHNGQVRSKTLSGRISQAFQLEMANRLTLGVMVLKALQDYPGGVFCHAVVAARLVRVDTYGYC